MYALGDFGSFHAGGRIVTVSGKEKRIVRFTRGHGRNLHRAGLVDSSTPMDRGMNSYTGPPRIRYRAMNSGVTLIRIHRFFRLAAVGPFEGYCRLLPRLN